MSIYSVSSASKMPENFLLEDDSTIEYSRGRDFVDSIVSNTSSEHKISKKEYPAFRKMFWENPLYNPPIANPFKISYEQQFGEMAAHWSRAGKKFSDEPRLQTHDKDTVGPTKPEEFPHCSEKPVPYWGHERVIDPFRVARYTAKPVTRHVARQKKNKVEETAHLGPGMYKLQDPWLESKKKICGIDRPSSCFLSHRKDELVPQPVARPAATPSKLRSLMQRPSDRVSVPPDSDASNIVPLSTGMRHATSINELFPARTANAYTNSKSGQLFSANSGMRRTGMASASETNIAGDSNLLSGYLQLTDSEVNSLTTEGEVDIKEGQLDSVAVVGFGFERNGNVSAASLRSRPPSPELPAGTVLPARSALSPALPMRGSPKSSSQPGFSFQKGELGPNAIDVPNGSTDADKSFRRVAMEDGSHRIIPVSPTDKIPSGSRIIASWATMASSMRHDDTEHLNNHGILLVNERNTTVEAAADGSLSRSQSRSLLSTAIPPQPKTPKSRNGRSSPNLLPGGYSSTRPLTGASMDQSAAESTLEPTIGKHTPWHPPKYQSKSHAQKTYETKLMKKFNISPDFNRTFGASQSGVGLGGDSNLFGGPSTAPVNGSTPVGQRGMRRREMDSFNNNRSASRNLRLAESIDPSRTLEFTQRSSALLTGGGNVTSGRNLVLETESLTNSTS